ncbi:sulfotransferase family protein [Cerasicoccus fimbriatus]|uniref:sulfotransferase family protein n=1 Tax=Cerasicoccus fimbriatus TaxID=3014554 RepID=UPI0022B360AE|nr:sulfotransferase [Cerasicoccus sp. TK19100]
MKLKEIARKVLEECQVLDKRTPADQLPAPEPGVANRQAQGPKLIAIHGIQQRSGTVFLGELIRLHPQVEAFPKDIWEAPLLPNIHHIEHFENDFFQQYEQNRDKLPKHFFSQLMGRAFLEQIQETPGKTILLKVPSVQHLQYFPVMFPGQKLVIIIRDGRDNVASTIKTWPDTPFQAACERWNQSAREILAFREAYGDQSFYTLVRFEDLLDQQEITLKSLLERLELPRSEYPFNSTDEIEVIGSSDTADQGTPNWDGVKKPANFSPTKRWADWSSEQLDQFNTIAGESMRALGYTD